jgi:hypothetical protein
MKPTEQQKELISKISKEIAGWTNTNDIDSPSNWNLIEELIEEFCDSLELPWRRRALLNKALDDILSIVKGLKS